MELIIMIVVAFPLGYFVRSRSAAYIAYIAIHSFTFTFQTSQLLREWVGGSDQAFPKSSKAVPWAYFVVNLAIYGAAFCLITLGHAVAQRRRQRNPAAVDLAETIR